jgi:hypothetical protein
MNGSSATTPTISKPWAARPPLAAALESLAEGVLPVEVPPHERLVHHHRAGGAEAVPLGDVAPAAEGEAHRRK